MTITAEQLAAFENLQDADEAAPQAKTENAQFDWGEEYQRSVLASLVGDRSFLHESIGLLKPEYFTNKAHKKIAEILFRYFTNYRNIPSKQIFSKEMKDLFKDDEAKYFYLSELQYVYDSYEPGLDSREYHQKQIFDFAKMVSLKRAFHRSMEELKKKPDDDKTWSKIDKWLDEARIVDLHFNEGLDYFGKMRDRYVEMAENIKNVEVFTTGFKPLDDEMTANGMRRGEIYAFMGPPGVGKSLCLVKCAVDNVKLGKKVLYISLEMSENDIATRFDAQFADIDIRCLLDNESYIIKTVTEYVKEQEDKRQLLIKQFPSGAADINTIFAYLQQLQMIGYVPDLIVVDYVGEMKDVVGVPLHESREKLVKDLRGLAVNHQVCVATALQPNRAALEAVANGGVISDANLGDSYGQLRPLDGLYTINQTDIEKKASVARIYVAKARSGKAKWVFYVSVCPRTLRFEAISEKRYRFETSQQVEQASKNVQTDEVKLENAIEKRVKRFKPRDEQE